MSNESVSGFIQRAKRNDWDVRFAFEIDDITSLEFLALEVDEDGNVLGLMDRRSVTPEEAIEAWNDEDRASGLLQIFEAHGVNTSAFPAPVRSVPAAAPDHAPEAKPDPCKDE